MNLTVAQLEEKIAQVKRDISKMQAEGKEMGAMTLSEYKSYLEDELKALVEKGARS